MSPARRKRHPEYLVAEVFVAVFGIVAIGGAVGKPPVFGFKSIRNVFQEDQAQHDVLVFGGVHVGAEFVGGGPEGAFEIAGFGCFL